MSKTSDNRYSNHAPPVTRRDFLSRGLLGLSGTLLLPQLTLSLLTPLKAQAKRFGALSSEFVPFLVFDCAGGAALPGNFLVGATGGPKDLLPSYDFLGWNPRESGALDSRFGLPMSAKYSQILAGILETASPSAQANLRLGSFLHFSQDDSGSNFLSAAIAAFGLGARGSVVDRGFGLDPTLSGGNSSAIDQSPSTQPLALGSIDDVLNAISFGPALQPLASDTKRAILQAAYEMSEEQTPGISGMSSSFLEQLAKSFQRIEGYAMSGGAGLDPRSNRAIASIYGVSTSTEPNDSKLLSAAIAMNALQGNIGPSVITIPNCDYHTGEQTEGDRTDLEIGRQIGRAIQAAYTLKKPLFFQVITDGGVAAERGTRNWQGDAGDKGMTVVGFYDPVQTPELLNPDRPQIGAYTPGQGADLSTLVGGDPAKVAYGALANYLQLCGKLDENRDMFSLVFGAGSVEDTLLFAPRRKA